jgi:hypothetical protein
VESALVRQVLVLVGRRQRQSLRDRRGPGHAIPDPRPDTNPDARAYPHADAEADPHPDAETHPDADPDGHGDADTDTDARPDRYATTHADAEPNGQSVRTRCFGPAERRAGRKWARSVKRAVRLSHGGTVRDAHAG